MLTSFTPSIVAIRFKYKSGFSEGNFETLPFYKETLRSFLRENVGKVTWLKGGIIEQPAYLIFYSELKQKVVEMLSSQLRNGGLYVIEAVKKPSEVIKKYIGKERVAVGYLNLGTISLGSPESLATSTKESELIRMIREGFLLTNYQFIKADSVQIKGEWCILENVVEVGLNDGKITYVHKQPKMGLRVSDIKFHPTTLKELRKLKNPRRLLTDVF